MTFDPSSIVIELILIGIIIAIIFLLQKFMRLK